MTAALSVAGVATSMAQVYSVNAVGYVNTVLKPGFNLVSNPLTAADNTIGALFAGLPDKTQVYKYDGANFAIAAYSALLGKYGPPASAALTVMPGEGVFVRNPTAADVTVTFVGEVSQGDLKNPLPAGLSIRSSIVPQAGTASVLGFVGGDKDQIYQFDPVSQGYKVSSFSALLGKWAPVLGNLNVGEAIFVRKIVAGSWDRSFTVN